MSPASFFLNPPPCQIYTARQKIMLISPVIRRSNPLISSTFHKTLQCWNHTEVASSTASPIANDDVIHRVDLRVGKIVHIEQHAEASHLFIEQGKPRILGAKYP